MYGVKELVANASLALPTLIMAERTPNRSTREEKVKEVPKVDRYLDDPDEPHVGGFGAKISTTNAVASKATTAATPTTVKAAARPMGLQRKGVLNTGKLLRLITCCPDVVLIC